VSDLEIPTECPSCSNEVYLKEEKGNLEWVCVLCHSTGVVDSFKQEAHQILIKDSRKQLSSLVELPESGSQTGPIADESKWGWQAALIQDKRRLEGGELLGLLLPIGIGTALIFLFLWLEGKYASHIQFMGTIAIFILIPGIIVVVLGLLGIVLWIKLFFTQEDK